MFGFSNGLGNALGYGVVGGSTPEDFYKDKNGKIYIVNNNLISSYENFSAKPTYGDTIAALRNTSQGVIDFSNNTDATQSTLSRRPVYGITPKNGRKNILNFSNKLTSSPWFTSSMASRIELDDENSLSGRECYKLTSVPNVFGDTNIYQNVRYINDVYRVFNSSGNTVMTASIFVKPLGNGLLPRNFGITITGIGSGDIYARFNFYGAGGVTITSSSGVATNCTYLDEGWYRIALTVVAEVSTQNVYIKYGSVNSVDGDGSVVSISSPQIEYGPIYTKYQDVSNYFDIRDEDGQNIEYLIFDGIDDSITMPVDPALIGTECDVILAGVKRSFIVPYTILENNIVIGPNAIGESPETFISQSGGIVAFGFISPRLTPAEYKDMFATFERLGASGDYIYPYETQIRDILSTYSGGDYEIFWPKPDNLYKENNFQSKVNLVGDGCKGFVGVNGTRISTTVNANNPILSRLPYGFQTRNLIGYSDSFDMWTQTTNSEGTVSITPNYALNPFNELTATRIQMAIGDGYTNSGHHITMTQTEALSSGTQYTYSFWAKSNTGSSFRIAMALSNIGVTGIMLTDTWQRFSYTGTANNSNNSPLFRLRVGDSTARSADFLISGVQLEIGSTPSNLQTKASRYDFRESGFREVWAIRFDGSDDFYRSQQNFDIGNTFAIFTAVTTNTTDKVQTLFGVSTVANGTVQLNSTNDLTEKAISLTAASTSVKGLMRSQPFAATIRAVRSNNNISLFENGLPVGNTASTGYTSSNTQVGFFANVNGTTYTNYFSGYAGPMVITKNFVPSANDMTRIDNILQEYTGARNA